jgi:DNA-binding response OmpR family regulator
MELNKLGAAMANHKLLVVDDELFVRELLEEYFSKLDFEILVANSGPAALKLVAESRFNVALIDLKMSDMDGIEVVKRIHELDENLVQILMTGYPTVESSVEAMRAGAHDYIIKPFRLSELKEIVLGAVKEHHVRCEINQIKSRLGVLEKKLAAAVGHDEPGRPERQSRSESVSTDRARNKRSQPVYETELHKESQLERWGKLLKDGLITQQEFEVNKNRILSEA